jgi:hypothetical protein
MTQNFNPRRRALVSALLPSSLGHQGKREVAPSSVCLPLGAYAHAHQVISEPLPLKSIDRANPYARYNQ